MAYDPNRTRGASEGRALRNIEQLLDDHRQSIIEVSIFAGDLNTQNISQMHFKPRCLPQLCLTLLFLFASNLVQKANLLSDALAQQVTVVRGQAEKSRQKSSQTLNAQQKLSRSNINRKRSGSSGSSGSSVSGRGQSMPPISQTYDRATTGRPSLGLSAAARKGPTSVSGFTPPQGTSPSKRPSSGGRAQASSKAPPRTSRVANR